MTVPLNDRFSGPYTCTGGETVLAYDFMIVSAGDIAVWRRRGGADEQLAFSSDYSVDGVGASGGGNVTLAEAAEAGDLYVVEGVRSAARLTSFVDERAFKGVYLNTEYDHLQTQLAEVRRDIARAIKVSRFDASGGTREVLAEAGMAVGFDDDGNATAIEPGTGGGGSIPDPLPVDRGGTGGNTAAEARTSLGIGDLAIYDEVPAGQVLDAYNDSVPAASEAEAADGTEVDIRRWSPLRVRQAINGAVGVGAAASTTDTRITTIGITNGNSNKYLVAGTADGRVLVWGDTASFAFNPVGDRYTAYELPVPWASTISVEAIYCGLNYVLFQTDEATDNLYHIGSGAHGQAGNGGTTAHTQITKVGGLTGVKISRVYTEANRSGAETFWFALTSLGRIYSCGYSGAQHVMGYNNTANLTTPRLMTEADGTTPLTGIVGMAVDTAYAPVAAWTSGGKLLRWGAGTSGAHGNNSTSAMTWPDYLETAHGSGTDRTDIAQAVVTGYSTYANMWLRTTAGKIEVAGQRQYGNGDGAALGAAAVTTFQPASGAIAALTVAALFAGGGDYVNCLAITSAGQGYLCGYMAGYALLGNGATTNLNVFTLLSGLPSGFAGALTAARISGGASYTTVFIEATISGVKVLASIGYDVYYNTAKGTASVAAASQTWGLVKGSRGTIAAWQSFGTHQEHGLAVLNSDGELRTAGPSDQGQSGVSGGQTTAIDILQPVRTGLPRLLKVPVLRGAYSAVTEYSYQDEVTDQGGTWRYIHATASTGNAPPTLPTTSNTYWRCVAEPGDAGFANIVFDFDGGTSALTTGMKCRIPISFDATIMSHTLIADTTGSIVLDVWKDTYANYPPTVADTIAAAAKPTLSAAQKATDSTLTGWTTTINAGDILLANIDSVSGITNAVLTLKVQRTT